MSGPDHSESLTARERQIYEMEERAAIEARNDARRGEIVAQVHDERENQDAKWGADHDDKHGEGDWTRLIVRQLGQAEYAIESDQMSTWRQQMIQVAALAEAAVESYDRKAEGKARAVNPDEPYIPF